jgi:hypothetical protein
MTLCSVKNYLSSLCLDPERPISYSLSLPARLAWNGAPGRESIKVLGALHELAIGLPEVVGALLTGPDLAFEWNSHQYRYDFKIKQEPN